MPEPRPRLAAIFLAFLRLGSTAFGGPAMVPYIREMAVNKKGWISEELFRTGMALCQSVPGATAMQVAAYVGLRARGLSGALAAYLGFGLPAFCLITALSALYATSQEVQPVLAAFTGLKFVVVALIANASLDFARTYLTHAPDKVIALGTGLVLGLKGNPILAIIGACLVGLVLYRHMDGPAPELCCTHKNPVRRLLLLCIPLAGLLAALALLHPGLFDLAMVMFKVDLFAFGGGYVSLPLMLHEVTTARTWMSPEMFMDGIALGQVTPGPIVITSAFVGHHLYGLAGAVVAGVFAFVPSLVILVGVTPYFDRLQSSPLFRRAVRASLASLVGLMAAVFARFAVSAPWSPLGAVLCLTAFIALRARVDILWVVLAGAGLSVLVL
ncbi:MAG: chromate efflux transporter [Proteobacteria bacterium]|nr:chromate efflux transporter [Pseudomonadota bacterium]